MENIQLRINGRTYEVRVEKNYTLLYVLRDLLDITGPKEGCGTGDCGACKVLIDGQALNACTTLAVKCEGKEIVTIEGIADGPKLHPIQESFVEKGAVQCGFCTPGMVISAKALLDQNPKPTRDEIKKSLNNNLCRCTGYVKIVDAIEDAAQKMRGDNHE
jgi:carbon-monoxide dehydrogenase small subunit